jgi:DNA anti-recombination protein RmuC
MMGDAKEEGQRFDEAVNPTRVGAERWNTNPRWYFDSSWGSGDNFAAIAQSRIQAMKSLDGVLGKIAPKKHYRILNSHMDEFAISVSQIADEETKIKQELQQAGNDIFRLVEARSEDNDERREQLRSQTDELNEDISKEIQHITDEINARLEEYRSRIVGDLSKVGNLETASEEMRGALEEVLQKVELEIITRVEATQKEIADKTALLREMMNKTTALGR